MNRYSALVALLGTAVTLELLQPRAVAQNYQQVERIAKQVTVQIDGQAPGSGVIVARRGQTYFVLTAAHVVATADEYDVVTPDGKQYPIDYKLIKKFPGVDLALVPFTSALTYQVVAMGNSAQVKEGSPAYIAGFPLQGIQTTQTRYQFSPGEVMAQSTRPLSNGYALAYMNDTFAGMSGGPIFDLQGKLIGIHGASKTQNTENQGIDPRTGLKTGLNLGIPIDTFLRSVPQTSATLPFPPAPPLSTATQTTTADVFIQAVEQIIAGNQQAAMMLLEQVVRLQPNYAAAYFMRAQLKDSQGAIADYDQAIRFNPNNARAYNNRANVRTRLNDLQGALADLDQAIRLDPNLAMAYNNRGLARAQAGDRQGSMADFDQAIRLDPNLAMAYNNRGFARAQSGDRSGAITDFNQALRLNPNFTAAYGNRGFSREQLKDLQGALADYDQALRLDPNFAFAYLNRGVIRGKDLQDYRGAIADFDQVLRLEPNNALAYNNRGLARTFLQDDNGAIADYSLALRFNPDYALAYNNRGLARARLQDRQGASADFQKAAALAQAQGNQSLYNLAIAELTKLQR